MKPQATVRLHAITEEVPGVHLLDLRSPAGGVLPPFTAGAHVDLHLANGLIRSYSLVSDPDDLRHYVVAVKREQTSRGGSQHIHEKLRVGDELVFSGPRNNFELVEEATSTVLIAGGIGITPLFALAKRLDAIGRDWRLVYCAKSQESVVFKEQLKKFGDRVQFHFSTVAGKTSDRLDVEKLVATAGAHAHLYCCGPKSLLSAFEQATKSRSPQTVHVEHFSGNENPDTSGTFEIVLKRSGRAFVVPEGKTILDVLLEHDVELDHSCTEGVCGSCVTRVLAGEPDHCDFFLSSEERAKNDQMAICCSRAKSASLVLDL